jgi:hypothetical protein
MEWSSSAEAELIKKFPALIEPEVFAVSIRDRQCIL